MDKQLVIQVFQTNSLKDSSDLISNLIGFCKVDLSSLIVQSKSQHEFDLNCLLSKGLDKYISSSFNNGILKIHISILNFEEFQEYYLALHKNKTRNLFVINSSSISNNPEKIIFSSKHNRNHFSNAKRNRYVYNNDYKNQFQTTEEVYIK